MSVEGYELSETLSQTATTVVRRATRSRDGAKVVVKTLAREYPSAREIGQLEFEHRVLRKLESPGVVRVVDFQREGHRPWLVLEDCGGESLARRPAGPMPLDRFFDVALGAARALGVVHGHGVVHKDVTPGNVLFAPSTGEVKLIDFSISSELSQEHQGADPATHLEGTLPYVSPEQTGRMNRDLDYRTDYYSFGVTLFELLTGALPFSAADVPGWVHAHLSKPAPSARDVEPSVPEGLARIVAKLMAKSPDDRYQSAHGLVRDLEACRAEWEQRGEVAPFELGRHDVPERFQVSQALFGRERESAALVGAFERASRGAARLLLVAGYSGVGKSALIHELQREIVAKRAHFVAGKFDQLERNVPYGAIVQAVRALAKQLLGEPEASLAEWRRRLAAAVGANGRVLVDLVPELERVLGPQPAVPELQPREAQARFQRVFAEFVRAAARPEHPLVVFVDDLQWADAATPELLVHLLSDPGLRHVLVLGSYRDNEVGEGHPLLAAIERIREPRPDAVERIRLEPLPEASVNRIVADTLHCDEATSRPLAELIAQKTAGNPFFVKELLGLLARDGAFRFVADQGRWDWDYEPIRRAAVTDNVVDLMVQRLRRLPADTIDALRIAACAGNEFDLQTVARAAGRRPAAVAGALWHAVRERVLVPLGSAYRLVHEGGLGDGDDLGDLPVRYQFQHDRVQQAAYSLLDEEERARVHLTMGRLLLAATDGGAREERVFDLVHHLNLGRRFVSSAEERAELSRLNEIAGKRAGRASAYAVSARYFEASLDGLSEAEWSADPGRRFDCRRQRAEAVLFSGDPDRAAALCEELVAAAPDKRTRIAALELKALVFDHQAKLLDAIATLREGLRLLGVELPEDPAAVDRMIGEGIGKMQAHLARTHIEGLVALPEMTDEEKITTTNLLFHIVPPAIQANPPLFVLSELLMFDLAVTHGTTPMSCKNFVDCGILQGAVLGDYDGAYRLGKVAFELLKREASRPFTAAVTFVFAAFVSHWRAPFRESLEAFDDAERAGLEYGDLWHTTYVYALASHRRFAVGRPLEECDEKMRALVARLKQLHAHNTLDGVVLVQRPLARLRAGGGEEARLEEEDVIFTERLQKSGNAQWLFVYGHFQLVVSVVLGDMAAAERWNAFASLHTMTGGNIQYSLPDQHLFHSLVLVARWADAAEAERAEIERTLAANRDRLATWAAASPANFAHKHKLVCAEMARLRGAPMEEVTALYDEALAAAGEDFVHLRALVHERMADYWTAKGHAKIARVYLRDAYFLYERWGATAKLRRMRARHPKAFDAPAEAAAGAAPLPVGAAMRTGLLDNGAIDLESLIKATHAVSSEVRPERLFSTLMATIIENAGAQRGCLVLPADGDGELTVEARAGVGDAPGDERRHVPLAQCAEASPDIVRYVARTRATVVVGDARQDDTYRDDPYVAANGVRSVLCMPVVNQGKLVAILYAENNAAPRAFTPGRLRLLEVIASQAAISITNAKLYDSLEEKVAERTRELAEKNHEVAAMLNSMQQGVFTIDDALAIGPRYSPHLERILGTSDIAGRDCVKTLFAGSDVPADAVESMRAALLFSFHVVPEMAEVNAAHLVRSMRRADGTGETRDLEVDWSFIADDAGEVSRVLVAVRDVTVLRQLRESVAEKAREIEIVGQILDAGLDAFQRFGASTHALLEESATALRAGEPLGAAGAELLFRNMHTIKGNARMLGLAGLVDGAHAAEQAYEPLRRDPAGAACDRAALLAGIDDVAGVLRAYEEVCRRKLSDVGRGGDRRQAQALSEIAAALSAARSGATAPNDVVRRVERALSKADALPLRDLVRDGARMLSSLARELGKPAPEVDCSDAAARVSPAWAPVLRDVLVHVFRNAIDHGIESAEEREAAGKPAQGRIRIRVSRKAGRTALAVSDDGRGLRLAALRAKLGAVLDGDEEVADRIFASGVSTAARLTTTSGRGVGMDAVRSFVRRQGGEARVSLTGPERDGCRPFELVVDLPDDAVQLETRDSTRPPPGGADKTSTLTLR